MIQMPHLSKMDWDYRDRLIATSRTIGSAAETTFYTYDLHGERVRKITESSTGTKKQERIYVGRFEVYREYSGNGTTVSLERETMHVMDDKQRIALVERRTQGTEGEALLIRYQMSNHLGTACLELDQAADIISYEEYTPYGSTTYQAVRAGLDKNPKRYRYTGKERDEENGLSYHSARYYASWLGRWTACDPSGISDGLNLYSYVSCRPIVSSDPTGKYGEAGHYYTTYLISLAAGFSPQRAFENAFYAQLPDEIRSLDAQESTKEVLSARAANTIAHRTTFIDDIKLAPSDFATWLQNGVTSTLGLGGGGINPYRLEAQSQLFASDQRLAAAESHVQQTNIGFHVLTGGQTGPERTRREGITLGNSGDSVGFGLSLHAFGDSYAHSRIGEESRYYNTVVGHGVEAVNPSLIGTRGLVGAGHAPDQISERPGLYLQYTSRLLSVLSSVTGNSRMSDQQLNAFVSLVGSKKADTEQIEAIRNYARTNFGVEMADYRPESHDAGTLDDLRSLSTVQSPGHGLTNPISPALTEQQLLQYGRRWSQ